MEEQLVSERIKQKLNQVNLAAQTHLSPVQDHVNFTLQVYIFDDHVIVIFLYWFFDGFYYKSVLCMLWIRRYYSIISCLVTPKRWLCFCYWAAFGCWENVVGKLIDSVCNLITDARGNRKSFKFAVWGFLLFFFFSFYLILSVFVVSKYQKAEPKKPNIWFLVYNILSINMVSWFSAKTWDANLVIHCLCDHW